MVQLLLEITWTAAIQKQFFGLNCTGHLSFQQNSNAVSATLKSADLARHDKLFVAIYVIKTGRFDEPRKNLTVAIRDQANFQKTTSTNQLQIG